MWTIVDLLLAAPLWIFTEAFAPFGFGYAPSGPHRLIATPVLTAIWLAWPATCVIGPAAAWVLFVRFKQRGKVAYVMLHLPAFYFCLAAVLTVIDVFYSLLL